MTPCQLCKTTKAKSYDMISYTDPPVLICRTCRDVVDYVALQAVAAMTERIADLDQRLKRLEAEQREVMTLDDVSALLGVHPATTARYYKQTDDPLPVHRPTERSLVFLRSEVLEWLKRQ